MNLLGELERLLAMQEELLGLAQVMVDLLGGEDLEPMFDAWDKRQRLFDQISASHRQLQGPLSDWEAVLAGMPPEEAGRARRLVDEASRQARLVLALDERAGAMLRAQLAKVGQSLGQVNDGQRLVKAYCPVPRGPSGPDRVSRTS